METNQEISLEEIRDCCIRWNQLKAEAEARALTKATKLMHVITIDEENPACTLGLRSAGLPGSYYHV